MSESHQIYELVPKVAAEIGSIGKNSRNQHFKFDYRSIDDVYSALHQALIKHGVTVTPFVQSAEYSGGNVRLLVDYRLSASDGSEIVARIAAEASDKADKGTAKALSMAYKYWAFQQFAIPVQGSEDADASGPVETPAKKAAATPTPRRSAESKNYGTELVSKLGSTWVPIAEEFFRSKKLLNDKQRLSQLEESIAKDACERFDDFYAALVKYDNEADQLT